MATSTNNFISTATSISWSEVYPLLFSQDSWTQPHCVQRYWFLDASCWRAGGEGGKEVTAFTHPLFVWLPKTPIQKALHWQLVGPIGAGPRVSERAPRPTNTVISVGPSPGPPTVGGDSRESFLSPLQWPGSGTPSQQRSGWPFQFKSFTGA